MNKIISLIFSCFFLFNIIAQEKFTLSGYIKDASNGETMIGATVSVLEIKSGVVTNLYGFYSITLPKGTYNIKVTYVGYKEFKKSIDLSKNISLNVDLNTVATQFKEVEVIGDRAPEENVQSTEMGTVQLQMDEVKKMPAFMGEVDIVKTITTLPGVQSAGEGNTGFYVRGGGPDQNLILLDEAVVYNASHLFGFFSVFNADAIKDAKLTKGSMPANYGGRISSVLDISMKDGNYKKIEGEGGIGIIASRLTLQGPIVKDKSSFIVSGRRTYIDVLAKPFLSERVKGSGYFFYDLNAKVNYILSQKDKLFLSAYFGRDKLTYKNRRNGLKLNMPWGNATASLRWNHLFNEKLFLNTTVIFTDYDFLFEGGNDDFNIALKSGIRDWNAKADFSYYPDLKHTIKFGANYTYHTFRPSSFSAEFGASSIDPSGGKKIYGNEYALYAMDDFEVNKRLKVNGGLRLSVLQQIGPFTRFELDRFGNVTDSTVYESGENVKSYYGLEPRLSFRYSLNETSSIKAGYSRNYQFVHLTSLSGTSLPTDVWLPSTDVIKPQIGNLYSVGYFKNFLDNKYEASIEVYYKTLKNQIEYGEGENPSASLNSNPDAGLVFGKGTSYGVELFIKRRVGKFTGWLGYTWSKTTREFDDINNGNEFPARFDRRHDLSITTAYDYNKRWSFGAIFTYASGNNFTVPDQRYYYNGNILTQHTPRNGYRQPAYHRLDFSATLHGRKTRQILDPVSGEKKEIPKKITSSWNFSVYNVYARQNTFFTYFDYEGNFLEGTFDPKAFQVSLFSIIPAVTWNFKF